MKTPQTKQIGEHNITVSPWPARVAWKNQITFGRVLGPSLKELGAALESKEKGASVMDSNLDYSSIGSAISNLFSNISEEESEVLLFKFLDGVSIGGQPISPETFDVLFLSDMISVYKIIGFVVEVNYGSFLGKSGIGKLLKKDQTIPQKGRSATSKKN